MNRMVLNTAMCVMLLMGVFAHSFCDAQNYANVSFGYDANGNRSSMSVYFSKDTRGDADVTTSLLTELEDEFSSIGVMFFPNPTPGHFVMRLSGEGFLGAQALLLTVDGVVLDEKKASGDSVEFDLSGRSPGLYVVRLVVDGESKAWSVVKK